MAKEKFGPPPTPDTADHVNTAISGSTDSRRDVVHVPGEGIYLSRHATVDLQRDCDKILKGKPAGDGKYYQSFIDEQTVENWYHYIQTHKRLRANSESPRQEYEKTCYPGTDTQDPTKTDRQTKQFEIDRSGSTISLHVVSGSRYLNGSSVSHHHYISIKVNSPDGREIVDVNMTFDQFASFLVSSMATPCTVDSYWSVVDGCVRLTEVVKPPSTIHDRMTHRLNDSLDEMRARLDKAIADIDEQIATGKAMSKTKLAELRFDMNIYRSHFDANRDFTVHQAREEVSSIVEQAAASIAWDHRLSPEELMANAHVQGLMTTMLKHKAIAAHQETTGEPQKETD